jgi:hypothetical protein
VSSASLGSSASFYRIIKCRQMSLRIQCEQLFWIAGPIPTLATFMKSRLSRLVSFYRDACDPGCRVASYRQELSDKLKGPHQLARDYSISTLRRLVFSRDQEVREAALWALGAVGGKSEYAFLGPWLRACDPGLRQLADRAREHLLMRTRSEHQILFAQRIESSMANSHWKCANRMVNRLVVEHAHDPQSWLLRVSIRLCTRQWLGASQDCRYLLSFDRDNYRACVFLGQCYWYMNRLGIAKECFLEASRIYPDCSAASLANKLRLSA